MRGSHKWNWLKKNWNHVSHIRFSLSNTHWVSRCATYYLNCNFPISFLLLGVVVEAGVLAIQKFTCSWHICYGSNERYYKCMSNITILVGKEPICKTLPEPSIFSCIFHSWRFSYSQPQIHSLRLVDFIQNGYNEPIFIFELGHFSVWLAKIMSGGI